MITKEEFNFWQESPITKQIASVIKDHKEIAMNDLLCGVTQYPGEKLLAVGERIGYINALSDMLSISFSTIEDEEGGESNDG